MLQEVLFVKKLTYELLNGLDNAVAIMVTQDLGPPGLTTNEISDFASHISRWRIDKAARLGTPLWQRGITMFIFWVRQFYRHSNKKQGETLLQVCISCLIKDTRKHRPSREAKEAQLVKRERTHSDAFPLKRMTSKC